MSDVTRHFAEYERIRAQELVDAERTARETGKEPFDWQAFRTSGCRPHGEDEHRRDYYVMHPEIRTMAAYIAHRLEMDPWDE